MVTMLLFLVDLVRRLGDMEYVSYGGCVVSIAIFYMRIQELFVTISLIFPQASLSQVVYLCTKQYFDSTLNYLVFDGCIFSTLFLCFHLLRYIFFGRLNHEELSSINDMLASTTLFRLVFMFYVFYYYSELTVFEEFAFWSIITEVTLCLKAISHLVIIRCKLVPQSFAFDQALPISTLCKFTFLVTAISLSASSLLIIQCYSFFHAQTGLIPLLCLLADTIIVVFDNIHALGLIAVHFYRKNTDIYVYYCDLLCGVFTEFLKLAHYALVIYVIGISFSLIAVYVLMRMRNSWTKIRGNFKAYISYREIYQALNHQYPDATKEELIIRKRKKTRSRPSSRTQSQSQSQSPSPSKSRDHDHASSLLSHSHSDPQSTSSTTTSSSSSDHSSVAPSPTAITAKSSLLLSSESERAVLEKEEIVTSVPSDNAVDVKEEEEDDVSESVEYETCGICREPMRDAKKLPCSHKFHLRCLMGWMRYKQTCPICRRGLQQGADQGNEGNGAGNAGNGVNGNVVGNEAGGGENNLNAANNADMIPWWLRMFGSFIQIHNVDIIEANGLNGRRRGHRARRRNAVQHRPQIGNTETQISTISEILGGRVSEQDIRTRLLRTHSMERTIEYFLANPR